jgi:hypothetical protein
MSGIRKANALVLVCSNMVVAVSMLGKRKQPDSGETLQEEPRNKKAQKAEARKAEPKCLAPEDGNKYWKYNTGLQGQSLRPNHPVTMADLQGLIGCKRTYEEFKFSGMQRPVVVECEEGKTAVIGDANCPVPDYELTCPVCFKHVVEDDLEPRYHRGAEIEPGVYSGCGKLMCKNCRVNVQKCPMCRGEAPYDVEAPPTPAEDRFARGFGGKRRPLTIGSLQNLDEVKHELQLPRGLQLDENQLLHEATAGNNDVVAKLECARGYSIR